MILHRWSLGEGWRLPEGTAASVVAGADVREIAGAELLVRQVTCIDCGVEFSQAGDRRCRTKSTSIARNHPCPCGSGRRYGRCCERKS